MKFLFILNYLNKSPIKSKIYKKGLDKQIKEGFNKANLSAQSNQSSMKKNPQTY